MTYQLQMIMLSLRQRSLRKLDAAGCPMWLARWWCKPPKGWGKVLHDIIRVIDVGDE